MRPVPTGRKIELKSCRTRRRGHPRPGSATNCFSPRRPRRMTPVPPGRFRAPPGARRRWPDLTSRAEPGVHTPGPGGRPAGPSARTGPRRAGCCRERPVRAAATAQGHPGTEASSGPPGSGRCVRRGHRPHPPVPAASPARDVTRPLPAGRGRTYAHSAAHAPAPPQSGMTRPGARHRAPDPADLTTGPGRSVHAPHRTDSRRHGHDTIPPARRAAGRKEPGVTAGPDELLTVEEVIAELRVPRSTFYRWRQQGTAPAVVKLPSGAVRIRRTALDAVAARPGRRPRRSTPRDQLPGQILGHQEDRRHGPRPVPGPLGRRRPRALQVIRCQSRSRTRS